MSLRKLGRLATMLDQKGNTKAASKVEAAMRKLADEFGNDEELMSDEEWAKHEEEWENRDSKFPDLPDFGEEEPSDAELQAMELGMYEPFEAENKKALQDRLKELEMEMDFFAEAISDGKMTGEDFEKLKGIQAELSEITSMLSSENEESDLDETPFSDFN